MVETIMLKIVCLFRGNDIVVFPVGDQQGEPVGPLWRIAGGKTAPDLAHSTNFRSLNCQSNTQIAAQRLAKKKYGLMLLRLNGLRF